MTEFDQGDAVRVLATLTWRASDKLFRLVSWMAIIVALRVAADKTGSSPIHVLATITTLMFSVTTMLQVLYLAVRDPDGFGLPPASRTVARMIQVAAALVLLVALTGPQLYLDQIIDALANAKIR